MLRKDGQKIAAKSVAAKPVAVIATMTIRSGLLRIPDACRHAVSAGLFCQAARIAGAESSLRIGIPKLRECCLARQRWYETKGLSPATYLRLSAPARPPKGLDM